MAGARVLAVQMAIQPEPTGNLAELGQALEAHREDHPDLVVLPEMFVCPYRRSNFPKFAEPEHGATWQILSGYAKQYRVYLIAGSVPERGEDGKVYNTSYVFDRKGNQIAKHRKVHLFDVDIKGGARFMESDTISAGDRVTVFDTEFGKMGLCICYDVRFPELFRRMVDAGAKAVFIPANFSRVTGEAHWDLTMRARAVDNQIYVIGCSSSRDKSLGFEAYGHTIFVNPWGTAESLSEQPGTLLYEMDFDFVDQVRAELPLLKHRRADIG